MSPPRISVLLPAFDAAATLPACLRSVARQTERDFECVIVDDGSTDATGEIADAFARRDPRFVVTTTPRRGLVAALNRGLERCTGRLVARMDADDWMHRDRLNIQAASLEADARLSAVGCHVRLFPRATLEAGMRAYERWLSSIDSPRRVREEAFVECPIAHPTLVARKEEILAFGYRDAGWPEDYDLVLRMLRAGRNIGVVPRRLLGWRRSPEQLSATCETYSVERFTACKAAFLAETLLAGGEGYVLWGYGGTGKSLLRALRTHGKRPTSIVDLHPRRIGEMIHGAPVISPDALPGPPGPPVLVSVAGALARTTIRAELQRKGFRETVDFACVA